MEGSCTANNSVPTPHWRNCSTRERAEQCGLAVAVSECRAFLNQTGLFQCICNSPDAIDNPFTESAFGTKRCLLRDSVFDECTSVEKFRCGNMYTRGCRARYVFFPRDTRIPWTSALALDPTISDRYIHNQSIVSDPNTYERKVECICSSSHSAFGVFFRSDFSPVQYAGPLPFIPAGDSSLDRTRVPAGPRGPPLNASLADTRSLSYATARRPLKGRNCGGQTFTPTFSVDISCALDFRERILRFGNCPVSILGGAVLELFGYALVGATPLSFQVVQQRTGSAYAAEDLLENTIECAPDATYTARNAALPPAQSPADYSASEPRLALYTNFNPLPCNGIGFCSVNETLLGSRSLSDVQTFYNAFAQITPNGFLIASYAGFIQDIVRCGIGAIGEYCPPSPFARPGSTNQCDFCAGSSPGARQFFYGPRCDHFDCPLVNQQGKRGLGGNPDIYPDYYMTLCKGLAAVMGCPWDARTGTSCHYTQSNAFIPTGFTGRGPRLCGDGYFDLAIGDCVCDAGFSKIDSQSLRTPICSVWNCPVDPTYCINGYCNSDTMQCVCNPGFTGPRCNSTLESLCDSTCALRGYCSPSTGQCVCDNGTYWRYSGPSCQTLEITSGETCQNGGTWTPGEGRSGPYCRCTGLWTGRLCEVNACPLSVVDGRKCGNGQCIHPGTLSSLESSLLLRPYCSCPSTSSDGYRLYRGSGCEYTPTQQALCFKSDLAKPICNSLDERCRFTYLVTNTSSLIKNGSCVCPEPFIAPYCEYTRCDNLTLGKHF